MAGHFRRSRHGEPGLDWALFSECVGAVCARLYPWDPPVGRLAGLALTGAAAEALGRRVESNGSRREAGVIIAVVEADSGDESGESARLFAGELRLDEVRRGGRAIARLEWLGRPGALLSWDAALAVVYRPLQSGPPPARSCRRSTLQGPSCSSCRRAGRPGPARDRRHMRRPVEGAAFAP